jgi:Tfp pilus assembly ATPase PilU
MQTGTQRGMQTMEQSLAELVQRHVVDFEIARSRSSRPDQLLGLLERAGFDIPEEVEAPENLSIGGLRVAGS